MRHMNECSLRQSTIEHKNRVSQKVHPRLAPDCDYGESCDDEDCGKTTNNPS